MESLAFTNKEHVRISSIDIARGIIMVIMALDHTRDFFHTTAFVFSPTDLSKTNTALFFTRWITHFCMPVFVLLAGTATRISLNQKSKKELSLFLLTRGVWMVLLEIIVMRFAFFFNFYFDVTLLGVLWLFGTCMILMSALIFLSDRTLLVIGLVLTAGCDLARMIPVPPTHPLFAAWTLLMSAGFLNLTANVAVITTYPTIPWLGVMLLGYSLGKLYGSNIGQSKRVRTLVQMGIASLMLFVVLRFLNVYGDPAPWSVQANGMFTFLSFLNATKYPVSLLFILMTLGPLLLLLAALEKLNTKALAPFLTIGRVPLFYFIVHFYLIHVFALLFFMQRTGKSFSEIDLHFAKSFGGITPEGGYSLRWVYVAWFGVVLIMYVLCRWYESYKSSHRKWWLSYL